MYWVIRWTDLQNGKDHSIVVEAKDVLAAETMAIKRNIPVVFIGPADAADVAAAREARLLWKYTPEAKHKCFGQPVGCSQLVCLMLCGVWTIIVLLQSSGVLPKHLG